MPSAQFMEPSVPTKADAKRLYEDLSLHSEQVGAYSLAGPADQERLHVGQSKVDREFEVLTEVPRAPWQLPRRTVVRLPSPWHAVIHLLAASRVCLAGAYGPHNRAGLLFRGQRRCGWDLVPSICRPHVNRSSENEVLNVFVSLLQRFYRRNFYRSAIFSPSLAAFSEDNASTVLHVATAQHYGIATDLLDFSTDPAVAVWFACQGATGGAGEEAAVFALPMKAAKRSGGVIALPHPYVSRLYRQHGVFVQPSSIGLRDLCIEFRFAPDPNFEVLRDGHKVDLLSDDLWWTRLVELSRTIVGANRTSELLAASHREALMILAEFDELLLPEFLKYPAVIHRIRDNSQHLLQMLLSISLVVNSDVQVIRWVLKYLSSQARQPLQAMYPILRDYLEFLPEASPLTKPAALVIRSLARYIGADESEMSLILFEHPLRPHDVLIASREGEQLPQATRWRQRLGDLLSVAFWRRKISGLSAAENQARDEPVRNAEGRAEQSYAPINSENNCLDFSTLEKWFPLYERFGGFCRVPVYLVPELRRKCADCRMGCEILGTEDDVCVVMIKGQSTPNE